MTSNLFNQSSSEIETELYQLQKLGLHHPSLASLGMDLWDKHNCIKYVYPKFLTGILTAKHIPLLLAIAGDKADGIKNIKPGMGIAHAVEAISNGTIPPIFTENYILPPKLEPYKKKILDNLKLTSFELQIQRIQEPDLIYIDHRLNIF